MSGLDNWNFTDGNLDDIANGKTVPIYSFTARELARQHLLLRKQLQQKDAHIKALVEAGGLLKSIGETDPDDPAWDDAARDWRKAVQEATK